MTKQTKGKIASLTILLVIGIPIVYSFADFYWVNIRGVQDDTRKQNNIIPSNPLESFKVSNPLGIFGTSNNVNIKKNEDLILLSNSSAATSGVSERAKSTPEGGSSQLNTNLNPAFKTLIIVKNQQPEAVGNNFLHMKNSYDITINNNTTTVFISSIDPRLTVDRSISINYDLAKRLGLEGKDANYEATAIRKK